MSTKLVAVAVCAAWTSVAVAAPTTEEKIEILSQELEAMKAELDQQKQAPGGTAGTLGDRIRLGGYGELHYNHLDSKKEIDFHRFVLFFGYTFSERVRFHSELELEHALSGEGKRGEVELEQAFIEFDLSDRHQAQGGVFLLPVGIINETHEPPTFYGVERNPIETNIVPATWWEAGAGLKGEIVPGLSYHATVTSGLKVPVTGANAYIIRSGRQKASEANADALAYTGRIRWTGLPGVELAASVHYQQDLTQSAGGVPPISATLLETHAVLNRGPFGLRALYARWDLDSGTPLTGPATGPSPGRDEQAGWYIEPSYRPWASLGLFARYNEWDNNAGATGAIDTTKKQTNIGLNYWPHEQVVLKFDIQKQKGAISDDGFNLGIGYMF